jgi:hypothetical protein
LSASTTAARASVDKATAVWVILSSLNVMMSLACRRAGWRYPLLRQLRAEGKNFLE